MCVCGMFALRRQSTKTEKLFAQFWWISRKLFISQTIIIIACAAEKRWLAETQTNQIRKIQAEFVYQSKNERKK